MSYIYLKPNTNRDIMCRTVTLRDNIFYTDLNSASVLTDSTGEIVCQTGTDAYCLSYMF